MNDKEAGKYWDDNAEVWTAMARAGFDIYRDHFNTPTFFDMLPDVNDLHGIDIGCGEGYNTRLLAQKGAGMEAIDISPNFIQKCIEEEIANPLGIHYHVASANELPFADHTFDFAASFMCLMDVPDITQALKEIHRVVKPNGFLQFSILHPCFNTPHRKNLRNENGETYAIEVGNYFMNRNGAVDEWIFTATPDELRSTLRKFKVPVFNRTLSGWMNEVIRAGFTIEQMNEPYADDETVKKQPALQDTQVVAYFLHVRCRKV